MQLDILHWQVASSHDSPPVLTIKARYYDDQVSTVVHYSSSNRKLQFTNARLLDPNNLSQEERDKLVHDVIARIRKTMLSDIGSKLLGLQELIFSSLPKEPRPS
jgi:hypothetical protein